VKTSGVNPSDWKARMGSRPMIAARVIPHSDGAGIIDRVGLGVPAARAGQKVWIWNGQWKRVDGTAAGFITVPAAQAVPMPDRVSFEIGACLGIPALTAYQALATDGGVQGKTVLVMGGAGAVGHYAVQMAKLMGARKVFSTVSSLVKAAHAEAAGPDVVINYKTENVGERVKALTDRRGVDRIVEVDIAGNASLYPDLIARDGFIVAYGTNAPEIKLGFGPMILSGAGIRFFIVYELSPEARAVAIKDVTEWIAAERLTHAVAATYPLEKVVEAHEAVEQGRHMGNVVVRI
jgi:NADPH2:quinone reductase